MTQAFDIALPPLRIAICGEVSSGKSMLLNALLRKRVVPDGAATGRRPWVHVGWRQDPSLEVETREGGAVTVVPDFKQQDTVQGARALCVWTDQPQIAGLELVEVPLTTAEALTDVERDLLRGCDVMIWVTIASQAWRLTEKTLVDAFGAARPAYTILAVSRTDKLRTDADRQSLRDRLDRETQGYFDGCLFLQNSRRQISSATKSDTAWQRTGAPEMLGLLTSIAEEIGPDRAAARLVPPTPEPAPAPAAPPGLAPETTARLTEIADRLPGEPLAGIAAPVAGAITVLAGPEERCRLLADVCRATHDDLAGAMSGHFPNEAMSAATLSTFNRRILTQDVAGVGLLFVSVEAKAVPLGAAQSILGQLSQALRPVPA